jgi:uncharacterized protein YkwD
MRADVRMFMGKRAAALAMIAVVGLGLSSCGFANTSASGPSDPLISGMYQALNQDRAANGMPPLTWSPKLQNAGGTWSHQMANANSLYHQNLGALIASSDYNGYNTLGENILVGPGGMTAAQMEAAWMASAPHRANITSGNFNIVGIGVYWGPDGRIWATVDFGGI